MKDLPSEMKGLPSEMKDLPSKMKDLPSAVDLDEVKQVTPQIQIYRLHE